MKSTITLEKSTIIQLASMGKKGDSYDIIVKKLMESKND